MHRPAARLGRAAYRGGASHVGLILGLGALVLCTSAAMLAFTVVIKSKGSKTSITGSRRGAEQVQQRARAGSNSEGGPKNLQEGQGKAVPQELSWPPDLDNSRVHAFYYLWYGNPETDGRYLHWNHAVLPHWDPETAKQFPHGKHFEPPEHLHSPFYPARGPYSSSNLETIRAQMRELKSVGVQVLAVSWWGPKWRSESADTQGVHTDVGLPKVFKAAELEGCKIALHLEPYPGRNSSSIPEDLKYLMAAYGSSPALLRVPSPSSGKRVPFYYVYDSYHIRPEEWHALLAPGGGRSIRGTSIDGFFVGLWVQHSDGDNQIAPAGFDGFYTYFASEAVSYASNPHNWPELQRWAASHGKLFIPSVGPGYQDSKIRPWNAGATRDREGGQRYKRCWESALSVGAGVVSITSYNEWGEGTQIEPARVFAPRNPEYEQYGDQQGDDHLYMTLTSSFAQQLRRRSVHNL